MANELYDGTRVFTAADGGTAVAADQNTIQDQLILGLEARTQLLSPASAMGDGNWTFQGAQGLSDPPRWADNTCNSTDGLIFPIPLRKKEYLEDIYVLYTGADAPSASGGEIGLYYSFVDVDGTPTTPVSVLVTDLGGANPWDVAGAVTVASSVGENLSAAATEDRTYFVYCESHNGAGASHARIYGVKIVTRFHIGA